MTRAKQVKNERSTLSARLRRNSKLPYVSLEDALIESNSQRPLGTLRSYPHLVLLVAQAWLWADMFLVSLRVKITERSSHLAVVFIVVGFVVSQTAQLIPGIVLSYIFGMWCITMTVIYCGILYKILKKGLLYNTDIFAWCGSNLFSDTMGRLSQ